MYAELYCSSVGRAALIAIVFIGLSGCADAVGVGRVCTIDAECVSGRCLPNGQCASAEADAGSSADLSSADRSVDADGSADSMISDPMSDATSVDSEALEPDSVVLEPDSATGSCHPNNDGSITAIEAPFAAGFAAMFRVTTEVGSFHTAPDCSGETCRWDLADVDGVTEERVTLTEPLDRQWYASEPAFADATYVSEMGEFNLPFLFYDYCTQLQYGVFEATEDALLLLGVVSETEDGGTKLIYDPPLALLRFPLEEGAAWTVETTATGPLCNSWLDYSIDQTLEVEVDARGALETPYGEFEDVLRVNSLLSRHLGIGVMPTSVRTHMFVTECFTSIASIRSEEGEESLEFDQVAEVQRLSNLE